MHLTIPLLLDRRIYPMDVLSVSADEAEGCNGRMEGRAALLLAN